MPLAGTTNVTIAASRYFGSASAAESAPASVPSSASPATDSTSSGGAEATNAVATAAPSPNTI